MKLLVKRDNINCCCRGVTRTAGGLHWCYEEQYEKKKNEPLIAKHNHDKLGKKVLCIELNQIFKSLAEAERETGVNKSDICNCCKGNYAMAGGYHWKYVE